VRQAASTRASRTVPRRRSPAAPVVADRETRARLLEEGRRLFAARGFRGVTVREICTAAGANRERIAPRRPVSAEQQRGALDQQRTVVSQETSERRCGGRSPHSEFTEGYFGCKLMEL